MLFNLLTNEVQLGIKNVVAKFADVTKFFRMVKTKADCAEFQKHLHKSAEWGNNWQMSNVGKH